MKDKKKTKKNKARKKELVKLSVKTDMVVIRMLEQASKKTGRSIEDLVNHAIISFIESLFPVPFYKETKERKK